MKRLIVSAAFAATIACAAPAWSQGRVLDPGPLWDISMIKVEDGHGEEYLDFLNRQWRSNQAFAKSQGWVLDYYILSNEYARDGEPDIYLVSRYADFPTRDENKRRDALMLQHMQMDARTADRQSGERSRMRVLKGSMLLRELVPAK